MVENDLCCWWKGGKGWEMAKQAVENNQVQEIEETLGTLANVISFNPRLSLPMKLTPI